MGVAKVVIGRNASALGINIALEPFVNIMRDPLWTRIYTLFGEGASYGSAVLLKCKQQPREREGKTSLVISAAAERHR